MDIALMNGLLDSSCVKHSASVRRPKQLSVEHGDCLQREYLPRTVWGIEQIYILPGKSFMQEKDRDLQSVHFVISKSESLN
jgi:hypothetical protein